MHTCTCEKQRRGARKDEAHGRKMDAREKDTRSEDRTVRANPKATRGARRNRNREEPVTRKLFRSTISGAHPHTHTHTHTHCCCSVHRSTTNFPRRPRGARRSRPPSLGATQRRAGLPARGNHPAPGHRSGLCNATLLPSGRSPGNWQPRLEPTPECPRAKHIPRGDLPGPSTLAGASCICTSPARIR